LTQEISFDVKTGQKLFKPKINKNSKDRQGISLFESIFLYLA